MTRGQAWGVHLTTLGVGGTGLVYAWMRYLCTPVDEFALANHPQEPAVQGLHLLFAPLFVFALGLVWNSHVWARARSGCPNRRRSGLLLAALFFPMTLSGVWVQLAATEPARALAPRIHTLTGLAWCALFLLHLLLRTAQPERGNTGPSGESVAARSVSE
jgi:hypothetical protein